ncbi:hypothetical protein PISL3812_04447 [Talaromyces islandicus]|uniref:Uncharacterized protein n=1 Tax=Talaromyces islandicus TaxID=28573 RepID=A0A0U1LXU0_TALIS|nr:hypothetical protein PISL3812_04447 [Talaromyces islandicus]
MCFYFPSSKNQPLESGGREPQWRYVRKRAGSKVGRPPRAVIPRAVLATPDKREDSEEGVVVTKTGSKKAANARPSVSIKPEKKHANPKKKTGKETTDQKTNTAGVPSWNSWENENDDYKKPSGRGCNKVSEDWVVRGLYIEKDSTKRNDNNEKTSKSSQAQNTNGKRGGMEGGKQNDKAGENKKVASNTKSENEVTTSDWKTPENQGDRSNSNENSWAPADTNTDWEFQEGWESGPSGTNNDGKPDTTDNWLDWDLSPGENDNSEEKDNTQQVPGAWPDGGTENDSGKDNTAKAENAQAGNNKNKKQANKQQQGNAKGSKKPRVKGKGGNATVEFCVCEADNSVSFKSAKEILENRLPGKWQQDDHGNPFFQRVEEEEPLADDTRTGFADTQTSTVQW